MRVCIFDCAELVVRWEIVGWNFHEISFVMYLVAGYIKIDVR